MRVASLFIILSVFSMSTGAQSAHFSPLPLPNATVSSPQQDPKALSALQAAVNALGGATAISQAQSWKITAAKQTLADTNGSSTVSYEVSGSEFRVESPTATGSNVLLTGHGNPVSLKDGKQQFSFPAYYTNAMVNPILVASLLVKESQDSSRNLAYLGAGTINGKAVTVVQTVIPATSTVPLVGHTWFFDASTNLPLRLEYQMPLSGLPELSIKATLDLSDYRTVSGAAYPYSVTFQEAKQRDVITVQSITINPVIATSDFDLPAGGAQ